jgi:hypothetical protein
VEVETLQTGGGLIIKNGEFRNIKNWWRSKHYKMVEVETLKTVGGIIIANWWR